MLERARKDLASEQERGESLRKKLMEQDSGKSNEALKQQIEKMKAEMARINNYSIDMAKNPALAIQRISDPILAELN